MGNFNRLPTDIVLDIITRLPTESILDCKLVCKPWRNLVSNHPSFYQMYLSHLNQSNDSGKLGFVVFGLIRDMYYFEYNETPIPRIRKFNLTHPFTSSYKALGSFNGLIGLHLYKEDTACICNPFTREYVRLPKIKRDFVDHDIYFSGRFGYLPLTNEYKVVELYRWMGGETSFIEVSVYTLGSGNGWRNAGRLEFRLSISDRDPGVFANGALHWMDCTSGRILVFDLTEEKFRQYLSPPPLPKQVKWHDYNYTIGELGGVLYYAIDLVGNVRSYIWLLKEKNDKLDSKQRVEHKPLGWRKGFWLPGKEPLAFCKSGGVLYLDDSSLCVKVGTASTAIKLLDFTSFRHIFPHKNTLVSLKELGEEEIKIMKLAEIEETEAMT